LPLETILLRLDTISAGGPAKGYAVSEAIGIAISARLNPVVSSMTAELQFCKSHFAADDSLALRLPTQCQVIVSIGCYGCGALGYASAHSRRAQNDFLRADKTMGNPTRVGYRAVERRHEASC
jgi:hypothetical protein